MGLGRGGSGIERGKLGVMGKLGVGGWGQAGNGSWRGRWCGKAQGHSEG